MRIATFILAILGAVAAAALGITWLSDASEVSAELAELAGDSLESLVTAGWLLILAFALGIAGGVLALLRRGRLAAGVLIGGAVAPALFEPKALVFTFLLLLAGVLSMATKCELAASP